MNKIKKNGHSSTYEFLNKDVKNAHKDLVERNKKMTPQELGMDEKFEDSPMGLWECNNDVGKVITVPTSASAIRSNVGSSLADVSDRNVNNHSRYEKRKESLKRKLSYPQAKTI
tara:strand:- start:358 stop:699 length:342 start_codon:yes stop_codon:yes gene_type:complete